MRSRSLTAAMGALLAAAAILAACGPAAGATAVNVTESVFDITLTPDRVQTGDISFVVTNPSIMRHEFLVIRTDLAPDALPTIPNGRVNEDAVDILNTIEDVPPHGSGILTLHLDPGHYVLICNLPMHWMQGMRADLWVTDANGNVPTVAPTPTTSSAAS